MEPFSNWEEVATSNPSNRVPLPHEDFDQYFTGYADVENMFNETLTGLQDLDVPSGFVNQDLRQQQELQSGRGHQIKHSRGMSGTAIFGFAEHNRELSISGLTGDLYKAAKPSMDMGKSISPGQLINSLNGQTEQVGLPSVALDFNFPAEIQKPLHFAEEEEYEYEQAKPNKKDSKQDYIVTNKNPKSYKFPPSPKLPPIKDSEPVIEPKQFKSVNQYSVKYLQELNKFNGTASLKQGQEVYADDIEPLLQKGTESEDIAYTNTAAGEYTNIPESQHSTPFNNHTVYKYIPIPTQNPTLFSNTAQEQRKPDQNGFPLNIKNNAYLPPPPSTPGLTNGSPEWNSSPEPQSPSPSRAVLNPYQNNSRFSSPIRPNMRNGRNDFYTPQLFSDDNGNLGNNNILKSNIQSEQNSSPVYQSTLSSSPIKFYTSPLRNAPSTEDDTMDANATITQLTPLKNQTPMNPSKNKVTLEWSPIISPNAKSSKDVKKALKESSPKRRVKKTSLLPPGELDQYWEGPDEQKIFTCTYKNCGKKFTRRYNVRSHIQTHLSDRPFACSYCPKKFVRQHDLNRHVKGHLEARYCKCACGKEFTRLDALRKHRARNICIGGVASNENHCITKPPRKDKVEILDGMTSERLSEDIQAILPPLEGTSPSD
mmetsp:Transcript_8840/g.11040  ORF Transcript_8840/g.11040 Transcript_8840/m.11040 type:complete len:652 (-) Transcript_8840:135-2090(-)